MYEDQTEEVIKQRMLERITADTDKSEGSFTYDAIAPASVELAQAYIELNSVNNNISIETATGTSLTELCYQNGTFRKTATKAIRKGTFNVEVPIGSRFNADGNIFIVIEKNVNFEYKLECEVAGTVGNIYTGNIIALDAIDGLTSAVISDIITIGVADETDEQLRERHKQSLIDPAQDGNVAQYVKWAEGFNDIGAIKVFPLWNGGNTVKVAITNRLFQLADASLVNEFQNYLDPNSEGLGNGVAPIGSKVTVTGGVAKQINITGNIVLAEGYITPEGVADAISNYLAGITYVKNSVSYMRIGAAILDAKSIVNLSNLSVNGGTADIPLTGEEIPIVNSINLTVVN